jgi:hypothetical protein
VSARLHDRDDALAILLGRVLALREERDGRDVIVRVTTVADPLGDALVAHVGALGAHAAEDPDRPGLFFVSVGDGSVTIPADRLTYVGPQGDGFAYAIDGGLLVRIEPVEAVTLDA